MDTLKYSDDFFKFFLTKRNVQADEVRLRVFLFPPAGSDISIFNKWEDYMPYGVEVCKLRLPGRGTRSNEGFVLDCYELAKGIAVCINGCDDIPFVIFGHSMGALIAYETVVYMQEQKMNGPCHLILSGMKTPKKISEQNGCFSRIHNGDEGPMHLLEEQELIKAFHKLGGIPDEVMKIPDFLRFVLHIFRNDLELCETYRRDNQVVLEIPITVFGGSADLIASSEELYQWDEYSQKNVKVTIFPGNHFYFNENRYNFFFYFAKKISEILEEE